MKEEIFNQTKITCVMPRINREEYEFLKGLDDKWKWIARDGEFNSLNVFSVKPIKTHFQWDYMDVGYKHARLTKEENKMHQFIQWEDEEPYSIQELLEEYEYSALERHLKSFKELSKAIRTKESEEI